MLYTRERSADGRSVLPGVQQSTQAHKRGWAYAADKHGGEDRSRDVPHREDEHEQMCVLECVDGVLLEAEAVCDERHAETDEAEDHQLLRDRGTHPAEPGALPLVHVVNPLTWAW